MKRKKKIWTDGRDRIPLISLFNGINNITFIILFGRILACRSVKRVDNNENLQKWEYNCFTVLWDINILMEVRGYGNVIVSLLCGV